MKVWSLIEKSPDSELNVSLYLTEHAAYEALVRDMWGEEGICPSPLHAHVASQMLDTPERLWDYIEDFDYLGFQFAVHEHNHPWVFTGEAA
jgi:hypothetical protein